MPVHVDRRRVNRDRRRGTARPPASGPPSPSPAQPGRSLTIGLVNNMAESAFRATERQFVTLLDAASAEDISIHLSLYAMPDVSSPDSAASHIGGHYRSTETLWGSQLDGLIVTGREPMTADLRQEPYWESFTRLLTWAADNTYSTVWSCLAAHAAVLHMDGIVRSKSDLKHFGVFECARTSAHRLTANTPQTFPIPHSRWNGLAEEDLAARGYTVLTRTSAAAVDLFAKQDNSLFVFFQGHPEYESDTLLREYRRDVRRYLRYQTDTYPSPPRAYFDRSTEDALAALREEARSRRNKEVLAAAATALEAKNYENTWHSTAALIYRNWLEYIWDRKTTSARDGNE